ncbi:MAG: hypothetical protein H0U43_02490 [Chthoniobacterales bacterium]|nr:hypothetical protein [Chthoniobacterales bacterium]
MRNLTCILFLTLALRQFATAADPVPQEDVTPGGMKVDSGDSSSHAPVAEELMNKSSFSLDRDSRNPFWPIGWKPQVKQTTANEQSGGDITPSAFLVSSIMTGEGNRFAIINGKPMQEGQVFGLQSGTQVYQITVKSIEDGQVILQRRDQELAVPLRRK